MSFELIDRVQQKAVIKVRNTGYNSKGIATHTSPIIEFNKRAFDKTGEAIKQLANSDGLHSHSESIKIRTPKP